MTWDFGESQVGEGSSGQLQNPLDAFTQGLLRSFVRENLPSTKRIQSVTTLPGDTELIVRGTDNLSVTSASAVSIATISGGYNGQLLNVYFNDSNVTLVHDSSENTNTLNLGGANITGTANTYVTLLRLPNSWVAVVASESFTPYFETFEESGTWYKPDGVTAVIAFVIGAGGGGGSGRRSASGGNRAAGAGGGGASITWAIFSASDLGSTETVTVGTGGAGGAAVTADTTNGNTGSNGGDSSFGSWLTAYGGGGGEGGAVSTDVDGGGGAGGAGAAAASTGGAPAVSADGISINGVTQSADPTGWSAVYGGGGGGGHGTNAAAGAAGGSSYVGAPGGGCGGGVTSGGTVRAGTDGGTCGSYTAGGGGAGGAAGVAGTAGGNFSTTTSLGLCGTGGGGGGGSNTAAGGAGGAGGVPGAGGGGGGASVNGFVSGVGGTGGNGRVILFYL